MKITLARRHHGVHRTVHEAEIPGTLSDYATPTTAPGGDEYDVDEDKLLAALPDGFLPVPPARILLAVEDRIGGTGQRGLVQFRDWAKYFDAYCLNLTKDDGDEPTAQDGGDL